MLPFLASRIRWRQVVFEIEVLEVVMSLREPLSRCCEWTNALGIIFRTGNCIDAASWKSVGS